MRQRTPIILNILAILTILVIAYYMFIQNSSFFQSPYFWGTVVISIILAYIQHAIGDLIENEKFKKLTTEEKTFYLEQKNIPYWKRMYDSAFKSQSTQEETDILIDHGFDGIKELDNQLPKWWLGLFYFGVAYGIVYLVSYGFTDFADPIKEYEVEHKNQIAAIAEFEKTAPQITLESAKYNADNVAEGQEVFKTNCVSCHGDGGKGGIGPNLTDDNWINKPESSLFKNVFHMVENGSPNNPSMQAFGKNGVLTGRDIEKVAAYVYHINQELKDITVAEGGAAPQGDFATWSAEQ